MKIKLYEQFPNKDLENDPFGEDSSNGYEILDKFDPEDDGYFEYIAKGINDGMFYLLDPDYTILLGPFQTLDDVYDEL